MPEIRFGTDGWRARMGSDFTFHRVKLVAQAYANFLRKTVKTRDVGVMVNYDTRFLSREFALEAAKVLSLNKFSVSVPTRDAPSPAVSLAIVQNHLQGAMSFTASFNELIYNGIKLFDSRGAPLMPSKTVLIEDEVRRIEPDYHFKPKYPETQLIRFTDIRDPYLDYLSGMADLRLIKRSGIKIVVDNLYGTSRDYLDKILLDHDIEIFSMHNFSDPNFGGVIPSCGRVNLKELARTVVEKKADIGLGTDIDSDRFGIVDAHGRFLDSSMVIPPLIEYLIAVRKMEGDIVKSISTTDQVNRVSRFYQRKVYETPVGFKYIADMMAFHQKSLEDILKEFHRRFPPLFHREIRFARTPQRLEKYRALSGRKESRIDGQEPLAVTQIDGIKYIFNDSWLLLRESGTENLIRIYAESPQAKRSRHLLEAGRSLIE
jgi:phosphoglucomutase